MILNSQTPSVNKRIHWKCVLFQKEIHLLLSAFQSSFIEIKGSLFLSFALPLRNGDALKKSGIIFEI